LIETISRTARALTLGARIRVNIIMGGILHRVIGVGRRRWGLLILCVFEVLVVIVQTYVLVLLMCLYREELE
jgi:F0F1-type ATP synthase membrane subunit a